MNKIMQITSDCYKNLEQADVMISILQNQDLEEKAIYIILEILSTSIKDLTKLIFEIQNEIKNN